MDSKDIDGYNRASERKRERDESLAGYRAKPPLWEMQRFELRPRLFAATADPTYMYKSIFHDPISDRSPRFRNVEGRTSSIITGGRRKGGFPWMIIICNYPQRWPFY